MIACISPTLQQLRADINTLRYADQVKKWKQSLRRMLKIVGCGVSNRKSPYHRYGSVEGAGTLVCQIEERRTIRSTIRSKAIIRLLDDLLSPSPMV
jgi:hypothetical protein